MSKTKNTGLGKGIGAIFQNIETKDKTITTKESVPSLNTVPISKIVKNPFQPRIDFDENALQELIDSIKEHGIIQPITVRRKGDGFELISGERRLRASKEIGLEEIPAYIIGVKTDEEMLEIALIENLQRDDLNPLETALGYKRLMQECGLTQDEVAKKVSKSRSNVTNFLRLLKLPNTIQQSLRGNEISMAHARTLLSLNKEEAMLTAHKKILDESLSVRATEELTKKLNIPSKAKDPVNKFKKSSDILDIEEKLRHSLSTGINIKTTDNKSGKIEIEFYSPNDFERIIEIISNE